MIYESEGTWFDPKLKAEYMIFSAHMDHIGISAGLPDSMPRALV